MSEASKPVRNRTAEDEDSPRAFPWKLFAFAFFGWTFDFYDLVLLGFVKEPIAHDLHLTPAVESWVLGVALSTSGLGGIVSGALADRFGKRTLLAATVLLYSFGSLVSGLAPNLFVFLVGRGIVGLGVGGEWAIGHGMLAEAVAPARRGRASAALQAGEPVGVALAAIAGFVILPRTSWRVVMIGSSVTALLAMFARRSMHLPDEPATHKAPSIATLARAGVGSRLVRAWILGVFKLGTYWTCYTWLPTFLAKDMGEGLNHSLAWMLTAQAGQLVGMLTFGRFADRVGRRPAFALYSIITALSLGPIAFEWRWLLAHRPLFWLAMLGLGVGSGCTAGFGALLAELFPTEVRGAAMGATYNCARAAQLLAPVIVHAAVVAYGLAGGLSVPMVLALATAAWVWTLPETRGIALPSLAPLGDRIEAP